MFGYNGKPYTESKENGWIYPLNPIFWSNWGHKNTDFVFLPCISFIIAFRVFKYIGN